MKKNLWPLTIIIVLFLMNSNHIHSQEVHFSQYTKNPVFLNPSLTGNYNGKWRFTNNYRNQWSALGDGFSTVSAGFDFPYNLINGDLGIGIYFLNDKSGSYNLDINKVYLSVAYHKKFGDNKISAGIQGGYVMHEYDQGSLSLPSQYNPSTGYFDSEMPGSGNELNDKLNFPDLNAGFSWKRNFDSIKVTGGISFFHLNKPDIAFYDDETDEVSSMRYAFNANVYYPLAGNWYVRPDLYSSFLGKVNNNLLGGVVGYKFDKELLLERLYGGTRLRSQLHSTDALIFIFGVRINGFDLGLSYDVNISGLRNATNMRGALEISLIYTNFIKGSKKVTIPCSRY